MKCRQFAASLAVAVTVIAGFAFPTVGAAACTQSDSAAYIGVDGNVYLWEACTHAILQLTVNGVPFDPQHPTKPAAYSFYAGEEQWSPDGTRLIVLRGGVAYLLRVETKRLLPLGQGISQVRWSPDGAYYLLASDRGLMNDQSRLSLVDAQTDLVIRTWSGSGPAWLDSGHILYFSWSANSAGSWQEIAKVVSLRGVNRRLGFSIVLQGGDEIVEVTQVASSGSAIVVQSRTIGSKLALIELDETEPVFYRWALDAHNARAYPSTETYRWARTDDLLAICEPPPSYDGVGPLLNDGAVTILSPRDPQYVYISQRCYSWTNLAWRPGSTQLAYVNRAGGLSLIDFASQEIWSVGLPGKFDRKPGPWWSGSGELLSVLVEGHLCIGPAPAVGHATLDFDCPFEAIDVAWRPIPK